jgi:hypothetical protein
VAPTGIRQDDRGRNENGLGEGRAPRRRAGSCRAAVRVRVFYASFSGSRSGVVETFQLCLVLNVRLPLVTASHGRGPRRTRRARGSPTDRHIHRHINRHIRDIRGAPQTRYCVPAPRLTSNNNSMHHRPEMTKGVATSLIRQGAASSLRHNFACSSHPGARLACPRTRGRRRPFHRRPALHRHHRRHHLRPHRMLFSLRESLLHVWAS